MGIVCFKMVAYTHRYSRRGISDFSPNQIFLPIGPRGLIYDYKIPGFYGMDP